MKNLTLAMGLILTSSLLSAQCTLSGLNSFYCSTDTISVLTASCNGTPTVFGAGINSNGDFDPSNAGTGLVEVYVLDGSPSYDIDQVGSFSPDTVPSTATSVSLSDDAVANNLSIGFTFSYFAATYTTFSISSNGFIFFGSGTSNGCCSGQSIPNGSQPNNLVAFAWEDLNPSLGGTIKYFTTGTSPNRKCVIDFNNIQHYGGGNAVTAQVHLYEGCGLIEIHTTSMPTDGGNHTMGIENSNGTVAYPVSGRNASSWTISNDYVGFIPECGDTFSAFVSGGPTVTFDMDSLECAGDMDGSITATADGFNPVSYLWSTNDTSSTISGLGIGTYLLTTTDSAGCESEHSISMYSPLGIGSTFDVDNAHCESGTNGGLTMATPTGGNPPYSYAWNTGSTGLAVSPLSPGLYTCTVTDASGCTIALNQTVGFDNEDPDVDLGDDKSICPDQATALVLSPGYASYLWSNNATTNSILVFDSGTYSVVVTSDSGCVGEDTIVVSHFTPDPVDLGSNLSGIGPFVLDAGSQYSTYLWHTGWNGQTITASSSGNFSVTVKDSNGCSTSDTIKVTIWTTSIDDLQPAYVKVYPNPTTGLLSVEMTDLENDVQLTLTDISGRVVFTKSLAGNGMQDLELLDLNELSAGEYVLSITSGNVSEKKLIIKQD